MKKFIFLGVVSLIVALIIKLPPSILAQQVNQRSSLLLQGTQGKLWKGEIAQVSYQSIELGKAEWSIDPLSLIKGKVGGDFKLTSTEIKAKGNFELSSDQKITLKQVRFSIESSFLNPHLQRYGTQLIGAFLGDIDYAIIQAKKKSPPILSGQVNWSKGGVNYTLLKIPYGNYQAIIKPNSNNGLLVTIESHEAALIADGNIKLDEHWKYSVDIKLATGERGQSLNQPLKMMIGQPNAQGDYIIRQTGSLSL